MSYRILLSIITTYLALVPMLAQGADAGERPNILWVITEDMGPELACYGTPEVSTPVLDRLAMQGVRYENAFTVTPVCSTSRSGFCTGMYPITIGAHQHRTPDSEKRALPAGVRPVTHWLRQAGYYTANIRKLRGKKFGTGKTDWNFKYPKPAFQGDSFDELKSHQPFYAQVNFSQSHRGWSAPAKADPAKVQLPPYYPDHPEVRKDWAEYLDEITEVDGMIGDLLNALKQDKLADNTIIIMFGDHGRAHVRGKQWCYDSGLRVPMIAYFPPGVKKPENFSPGAVDTQLIESIDITATTLDLAGVKKPKKMQGRIFLGPRTEPARTEVFASRDRCDMTSFRIRTVRDNEYRYIRNFMPDRPFLQLNLYKERSYPMISIMRTLHEQGKLNDVQDRLFAMQRPAEELYHTSEDPHEVRNLIDSNDPQDQAALKRLRGELEDWITSADDQGAIAEDPAIGLADLRNSIRRLKPDQRPAVREAIEQQAKSPGISEEYAKYLQGALRMLDEGK